MSGDDYCDFLFKIVLIGDCGAGKTCVVQRFKTGAFVERHGNTIGVDFSMKNVVVDGKKVKVRYHVEACCSRAATRPWQKCLPTLDLTLRSLGEKFKQLFY